MYIAGSRPSLSRAHYAIVCYQNNIENKICHNTGHATIAAPTGCSVVVDDRQLWGCIAYTYPTCIHDELVHPRIWIGMPILPTLSCQLRSNVVSMAVFVYCFRAFRVNSVLSFYYFLTRSVYDQSMLYMLRTLLFLFQNT